MGNGETEMPLLSWEEMATIPLVSLRRLLYKLGKAAWSRAFGARIAEFSSPL